MSKISWIEHDTKKKRKKKPPPHGPSPLTFVSGTTFDFHFWLLDQIGKLGAWQWIDFTFRVALLRHSTEKLENWKRTCRKNKQNLKITKGHNLITTIRCEQASGRETIMKFIMMIYFDPQNQDYRSTSMMLANLSCSSGNQKIIKTCSTNEVVKKLQELLHDLFFVIVFFFFLIVLQGIVVTVTKYNRFSIANNILHDITAQLNYQ